MSSMQWQGTAEHHILSIASCARKKLFFLTTIMQDVLLVQCPDELVIHIRHIISVMTCVVMLACCV